MLDAHWQTLLETAQAVHHRVPELAAFCPFPDGVAGRDVEPRHDPLCDAMRMTMPRADTPFPGFRDAVLAAAGSAIWRDTYRDQDGGEALHRHFGAFEILGRDTPLVAEGMRSFIVYQAPGFHYPRHHHPAEELYLVIAGEGEFSCDGQSTRTLRGGDVAFHPADAPHALTTWNAPIMAYVLWRGDLTTKPVFAGDGNVP
ncbi:dimethylsulfonioproprionate lyase family protein [Roseovarius salis]|uniref:dimethylsulfonioproprionate lyase family protein n=1 Tax=Roseovarius salis TaxID=3376063 RepID=UPI0037CBCD99